MRLVLVLVLANAPGANAASWQAKKSPARISPNAASSASTLSKPLGNRISLPKTSVVPQKTPAYAPPNGQISTQDHAAHTRPPVGRISRPPVADGGSGHAAGRNPQWDTQPLNPGQGPRQTYGLAPAADSKQRKKKPAIPRKQLLQQRLDALAERAGVPANEAEPSEDAAVLFDGAAEDFLGEIGGVYPETASALGLGHMDRLNRFDKQTRDKQHRFSQRHSRRLNGIRRADLDLERAAEHVLQSQRLHDWGEAVSPDHTGSADGSDHVVSPLNSVYAALGSGKPTAALARLQSFPLVIRQGRGLLTETNHIERTTLTRAYPNILMSLTTLTEEIARRLPSKAALARQARQRAEAELHLFFEHLKTVPSKRGAWVWGKSGIDGLLDAAFLPYDSDSLKKALFDEIHKTLALLNKAARRYARIGSWKIAKEKVMSEHPEPDELLQAYREQARRAARFVREHGIITVPQGISVRYVFTPHHLRHEIPFAAMEGPPVLGKKTESVVYVTPPPEDLSIDEKRKWLAADHNNGAIEQTAMHEVIPGHVLHDIRIVQLSSRLRRSFDDIVTSEGWAHYMEGVMLDAGFFTPAGVFAVLYERLTRLVEARVALALHTEGWSTRRGRRYLERTLSFSSDESLDSVLNLVGDSFLGVISYSVGRLEILRLRAALKKSLKSDFDQRWFHDRFVSYGQFPIAIIRVLFEKLIGTDLRG